MSDNMERVLGILSKLVAFPSVSSTSNKSIIDFIDNYLKQHGVITHRTVTEDGEKHNLVGRCCMDPHSTDIGCGLTS